MCYAAITLTVANLRAVTMINLLKSSMQILNEWLARYEQLRVNAENENQAMCCGAFNPRFLAMIKRSKANNNKYETKET